MALSRESFGIHAAALVAALQAVDDGDGSDGSSRISSSSNFNLTKWRLQCYGRSDIILVHAPIYSHYDNKRNEDNQIEDHAGEDPSLEDENVYIDRDSCNGCLVPQGIDTFQWNFSVVYNDTFQSPVLYFDVQRLNGEPCSRKLVLDWMKAKVDDSWEFLSQEQHPTTGHPSFFLHPCQTPNVLQTLMGDSDRNVLWAWLSWILGVVGHPIPAVFYVHVQNQILKSSE